MNRARLVVLLVAAGAAGTAALLMMQSGPSQPVVVEKTAPVQTTDVLVAGMDLPIGKPLRPEDMRWQPWPVDFVPVGSLTRSSAAEAQKELTGAIVRQSFLAGEPIRREKVVKTDGSGFMSAILPSGMRAAAMSIDTRGAASAGGFILPNDRVDILKTARDEEASKAAGADVQSSEVILRNIRVLAIAQNVQEKAGEKVVTGDTATLELTPAQVETLAQAQRTGQLSLILRSLQDANKVEAPVAQKTDASLTVVRFGVGRATPKQ
jgi:pilus assembly protein CpaB